MRLRPRTPREMDTLLLHWRSAQDAQDFARGDELRRNQSRAAKLIAGYVLLNGSQAASYAIGGVVENGSQNGGMG